MSRILQTTILATLVVIIICSESASDSNAEQTTLDQVPYFVYLQSLEDPRFHCLGSLVAPQFVVTAASCFAFPPPYHGKHLVLTTSRNVFGPGWITVNVTLLRNEFLNLAVVKLPDEVTNKTIKPIQMCKKTLITDSMNLRTLGWRFVKSPEGSIMDYETKLHSIKLPQTPCSDLYAKYTDQDIVCTKLPEMYSSCHDPTGGPLIADGQLVGVKIAGCQHNKYQASFNDICALRTYIEGVMRNMMNVEESSYEDD